MQRLSLPLFSIIFVLWYCMNAQARDACAIMCVKAAAQYNYGCEKPSLECLCNSMAGLGTLAIWVASCPDPRRSWGPALERACTSNDLLEDVPDLYALYNNATNFAIDASEIPANNITFSPVKRNKEYFDGFYLANEVLEYHSNMDFKHRTAVYIYWGAIIGIGVVSNIFQHLPTKITTPVLKNGFTRHIRGLVFMPATIGKRHSQPVKILGFLEGQIPTRWESLVIFGEIILLTILQTTYYRFYIPNPLLENKKIQLTLYLGRRSGRLCIAHLPFLFLFAFRNNILRSLTGWSISTFHVYHRAVGRIMVGELLIHTITFTVYEMNKRKNSNIWTINYLYWGLVGTCAGCAIIVTSFRIVRRKYYEIFIVNHVFWAIVFVVGTWYHLYILESYDVVVTIIALWGFEHMMRLTRVIYYGLSTKCKAILHEDGIVELQLRPVRKYFLHPGEYVFIHFLKFNAWESHPLSVAEYHHKTGEMTVFARSRQGMTLKLAKYLQQHEGAANGFNIWIDGPYGKPIMANKYRDVLFIAGGIGITAVAASAVDIATKYTDKHICLQWITRSDLCLKWGKRYLDKISDAGHCVEVHVTKEKEKDDVACIPFFEDISLSETPKQREMVSTIAKATGDEVKVKYGSRPEIDYLIREMIDGCKDSDGNTDMAVVVCGPSSMNDDARRSAARLVQIVSGRLEYFEEAFAW